MKIREMRPEDWNDVRRIYLEGIATGIATFQQSAPEYEDWDRGHLADVYKRQYQGSLCFSQRIEG